MAVPDDLQLGTAGDTLEQGVAPAVVPARAGIAPPAEMPPAFPVETPEMRQQAAMRSLEILQHEAATDPVLAADPSHQREIARATMLAGNPAAAPSGAPIVQAQATAAPAAPQQSQQPQEQEGPPAWEDVLRMPQMRHLSSDELEAARHQYFVDVVAPLVPTGDLQAARSAFDQDTAPGPIHRAVRAISDAARELRTNSVVDWVRSGVNKIDQAFKKPDNIRLPEGMDPLSDEAFAFRADARPENKPYDRPYSDRLKGYMAQGRTADEADAAIRRDMSKGEDFSQPLRTRSGGDTVFGRELGRGFKGLASTIDGWRLSETAGVIQAYRAQAEKEGKKPEEVALPGERAPGGYQGAVLAYQKTRADMDHRKRELDLLPQSNPVKKMFDGEGAEGVDNFVNAFKEDPKGASAVLIGGSVPGSMAMLAAAVLARFGGFTPTAAAGAAGVTSATTEFGNNYAENRAKGMSHDEAWNRAATKSAVIGAFDAASFKSAGAALDRVTRATAVKEWLKETSKQATLGAGGETIGSVASGEMPQPGQVMAEAAGEVMMAGPEGVTTMGGAKHAAAPAAAAKSAEVPAEDVLGRVEPTLPPAEKSRAAGAVVKDAGVGDLYTPAGTAPIDATWSSEGVDRPVKVTSYLGNQNGEEFFGVEGSKTGIPASQLKAADGALETLKPKKEAAAEAKPPAFVDGKETSFATERGAKIDGRYAVADVGELMTSHDTTLNVNKAYPADLQPRDRSRDASEVQIAKIAQNLQPAFLGESPQASQGAPIVGDDGVVESGNARTIALQRAYDAKQADGYRDWLLKNAEAFGLDPAKLSQVKRPVLVRVRTTPVNRAEFARQANESSVAALSPLETARADAARLKSIDDLKTGENGEIHGTENMPFVRRFVGMLPVTEQSALVTGTGELSQAGMTRVRNAILAKAYGGGDTVMRMVESPDDNIRNISNALVRAAPRVAKARESMAEGALHDLDITEDFLKAVEWTSKLRADKKDVGQWLAQISFFEADASPEFKSLMRFLDENSRSPKRIAEFIELYITSVEAAGSPAQGAMFGDQVPDKSAIIESAKKGVSGEQPVVREGEGAAAAPAGDGKEGGRKEGSGGKPGGDVAQEAAGRKPAGERGGEGSARPNEGAVDQAAHDAATSPKNAKQEPSAAQKKAGNFEKGHTKIGGLEISIENPAGSRRRPEWPMLKQHYGYIRGTVGRDKDHVDVFIKQGTPAAWDGTVFVVNQAKADGTFDEHKAMLGFADEAAARAAYLSNYPAGFAKRVMSIAPRELEAFKEWALDKTDAGPKGGVLEPLASKAAPALSRAEDKPFADAVRELVTGKGDPRETLTVSNTPPVLQMLGLKPHRLVLGGSTISKMLYDHGLPMPMVQRLPAMIAEPVLVFESDTVPGDFVVVTTEKSQGMPVVVTIRPEGDINREVVNVVTSGYPRAKAGEAFARWIKGDLLAYIDQQKRPEWQRSVGLQLPGKMPSRGAGKSLLTKADLVKKLGASGGSGKGPESPVFSRKGSATLFIDMNGKPVEGSAGLDAHGNLLQDRGVENEPAAVAKQGLIYVDSSGVRPLLIAGADLYNRSEVRRAAERYSAAIGKPVDVAFDAERFTAGEAPKYDMSEDGPRLVAGDVGIVQPSKWETRHGMTMYEHTIIDGGKPIGVVTLGWIGDKIAFLPNIRLYLSSRGKGVGESIVRAIVEHNGSGHELTVGYIAQPAREFWRKMGVRIEDTDEGTFGQVSVESYRDARPIDEGGAAQQGGGEKGPGAQAGRAREGRQAAGAFRRSKVDAGVADVGRVSAEVAAITKAWAKAPGIEVVATPSDLPFTAPADAQGAFWKGKVYLVASNNPDAARTQFTLFHEAIGHYGLNRFFGNELTGVLREISIKNANVRAAAEKWKADNSKPKGWTDEEYRVHAIEEALSDLAGSSRKITGLGKLLAKVQAWLRANGFEAVADWLEKASDAEALALLAKARETVEGEAKSEPRLAGELAPRFSKPAAPFYSELAGQVATVKATSAPPDQWRSIIKALPGVKAEEIEWSGVNDWLAMQGKRVTRDDVLAYLRENGVRVEEAVLGVDGVSKSASSDTLRVQLDALGYSLETDDMDGQILTLMRRADGASFNGDLYSDDDMQPFSDLPANVQDLARSYDSVVTDEIEGTVGEARYGQYVLPGGTNYREMLLTLPMKEDLPSGFKVSKDDAGKWRVEFPDGQVVGGWSTRDAAVRSQANQPGNPNFQSSHFNEPNIIAHARLDDRVDAEGKKVLFVEELQSDWAQKGKRDNFGAYSVRQESDGTWTVLYPRGDTIAKHFPTEAAARTKADEYQKEVKGFTQRGPFVGKTESWVGLLLKRVISYAAENGYDRVAWTTGEQQVQRYDLRKYIKSVTASRVKGYDDSWNLTIHPKTGTSQRTQHLDNVVTKKLPDYVGKDLAEKIVSDGGGYYDGLDLKVGGEGMRAFYDQIVPQLANGLLKKFGGGRVGEISMSLSGEYDLRAVRDQEWWTIEEKDPSRGWQVIDPDTVYSTKGAAEKKIEEMAKVKPQPGFDITPALRDRGRAGMPMFSRSAQTDAPEFKKWFGESKVVDKGGKPLVVYHGTAAPQDTALAAFKGTRIPESSYAGLLHNVNGLGSFFTESAEIAAHYPPTYRWEFTRRTYPVYLSIEKPKEFASVYKLAEAMKGDPVKFVKEMTEQGVDGLTFMEGTPYHEKGAPPPAKVWVTFRPEQVKSAIGNRGTFDRGDDRISFSRAQASAAPRRRESLFNAVTRIPTQALRIDKLTSAVYDLLLEKVGGIVPETVKAGLGHDYGIPEAVSDRRSEMWGSQRRQLREVEGTLGKLLNLTRAESRVAYEWMSDRSGDELLAQLPAESRTVLQGVKEKIDALSREAVRLGQLSAEVYERNRMAYLHRSYRKHELDATKQDKVARARAVKILGDQYKGRGMVDAVDMSKLKTVAPEWWGRKLQEKKGDKGLKGQTFIRLERRENRGEGAGDLPGVEPSTQPGRLREVAYWPAGEAVPARYESWRRDAGEWQVRDVQGGKVVLWRDFTKAERQRMGEIDEVRFAVAKTLHQMIHDVEAGRYLEWIANHHARAEDKLARDAQITDAKESLFRTFGKDEWVKVPQGTVPGTKVEKYGKLAGLYVPGPIWNDVRQVVNVRYAPLGDTYATLLKAWKISKTALSPAVHLNNVMANIIMADWHDVLARDLAKALRVMVQSEKPEHKALLEAFEDNGGSEGTFVLSELQKEQLRPLIDELQKEVNRADSSGMINAVGVLQAALSGKYREAFEAAKGGKVARGAKVAANAMIDLYQAEDTVFRLAAFVKAKADDKTDAEAGKFARKSFLDYSINAPWIQMMRSTAFPFVSFVYRAAPMLLETYARRPWKLMKLWMVLGGLNALGYLISGGDEDKERKLLPKEKQGRILGFLPPKLIRMPWNDAQGNPVFLDVRRFIPAGDVFDLGQTHSALPWSPVAMPGGPLALALELVANRSQFTGKNITNESDTALEITQKVGDHIFKALAPNLPFVPGTYSFEGIANAGKGRTDQFGREQSLPQALASSVGVKVGAYPADVAKLGIKAEFSQQEDEIKKEIRRLAREHARKGISTDDFKDKVQYQVNKLRRLSDETRERTR